MREPISKTIIVRSIRQPYVLFAVLLGPIIVGVTAASIFHHGLDFGGLFVACCMLGMLLWIYYYLYSLRLILEDDRLTYKAMTKSTEIFLASVKAIKRGRGPFSAGITWVIYFKDTAPPIVANVSNFDGRVLKELAKTLSERAPEIRITGL